MALNYVYEKHRDVYTIKNTGATILEYEIYSSECGTLNLYKSGIIQANEVFKLPITYADGVYSIKLSYEGQEETLVDILQYNTLLTNIIDNVEEVMCGCEDCGCIDCGEDSSECELNLNTLISELAFSFVFNPLYSNYINIISNYLKCNISNNVICYLQKQQVTGREETKDVLLQIIGLYYLSFYYLDLNQAPQEDVAYIKSKYKFKKINKCLKRHGIDTTNMEDLFFNYPVYYWQLNNPIDTIADVIPLLNDSYLSIKPEANIKIFAQGKIIEYSQIGRIVFTLKNADSVNFILLDSLGNDITDQFDTHYDVINKYALFVSKIPYSYGSIYFKFKKTNI